MTYLKTTLLSKTKYVVRKKPPGQILSRNTKSLHALSKNTDLPVPNVYCLCEDSAIIGTPFYVMEFMNGRIYTEVLFKDLPPTERKQCWRSAVSTLAKLHSVDYRKIGLADYGKDSGFYARQIKSLGKISTIQSQVKNEQGEPVGELPGFKRILAWFSQNLSDDTTTLIHGDYKIDNLVFHPTEPRVIGILDWELSTVGHPLSDLTNLLQPYLILPNSNLSLTRLDEETIRDLELPTKDELMQLYCEIANREYPIKNWNFFIAFSFFRLAVITQGIAARAAKKQASSAQAAKYAKMFRPLSNLVLAIIDQSSSKL
ncbi:APH-domain-containing protein [Basidiobolus meristosporus CBS 931.73]|uniref:APH-domain-containing protein n=1 Tax=Basidiobolus meristosporus CBS 931.73 TaxID=1314790 RepID=A0A1Y1YQV0_9FUNG|nr:APH-domain-containing protein [Basidiobolus meristosporus CBS 931.73]|eukprot:ORY00400.1 APH-domain-containing protein [Basidiobolus meristosporus CBS 931.73]